MQSILKRKPQYHCFVLTEISHLPVNEIPSDSFTDNIISLLFQVLA